MQTAQSPFPPGLVCIVSGDLPRFTEFEVSMWQLMLPVGCSWTRIKGCDIAFGRNLALRESLKPEHEWVWYVDDDNPFPPDMLMRLLTWNVDIVQPVVSNRKPPYCSHAQRVVDGVLEIIPWDELRGDLMEVDAVGAGGMLIKREVLDAIGDPWWKVGQQGAEHLKEDSYLCYEAKRLGFRVWVDLAHPLGHSHTHTVWPARDATGKWHIELELEGKVLKVPVDMVE